MMSYLLASQQSSCRQHCTMRQLPCCWLWATMLSWMCFCMQDIVAHAWPIFGCSTWAATALPADSQAGRFPSISPSQCLVLRGLGSACWQTVPDFVWGDVV